MKKKKITILLSLVLMLTVFMMPASTGVEAKSHNEEVGFNNHTIGVIAATDPSDNQSAQDEYNDMVKQVLFIINKYVVRSLLIGATIVFTVFGIINFVKFSKATEEEARQKAKKNLIGWMLGAVGTFACVWLLPMLFNFLINLMPGTGISPI